MWISSIILILFGTFNMVIEQVTLENNIIDRVAFNIIYWKHSVVVGSSAYVVEASDDELEGNSIKEKELYSGWQILYGLRDWLQSGINVVIDNQFVSMHAIDDFVEAANFLQLKVNYVAELSYEENMNEPYITSIKFKRR